MTSIEAPLVVGGGLPIEPTVLFAVLVTVALIATVGVFIILALEPYLPSISVGTVDEGATVEAEQAETDGGEEPGSP